MPSKVQIKIDGLNVDQLFDRIYEIADPLELTYIHKRMTQSQGTYGTNFEIIYTPEDRIIFEGAVIFSVWRYGAERQIEIMAKEPRDFREAQDISRWSMSDALKWIVGKLVEYLDKKLEKEESQKAMDVNTENKVLVLIDEIKTAADVFFGLWKDSNLPEESLLEDDFIRDALHDLYVGLSDLKLFCDYNYMEDFITDRYWDLYNSIEEAEDLSELSDDTVRSWQKQLSVVLKKFTDEIQIQQRMEGF